MATHPCLRALRVLGITLALGASLLAGAVHAQGSSSAIRILVGFPPGGGTDAIAWLAMCQSAGGETSVLEVHRRGYAD